MKPLRMGLLLFAAVLIGAAFAWFTTSIPMADDSAEGAEAVSSATPAAASSSEASPPPTSLATSSTLPAVPPADPFADMPGLDQPHARKWEGTWGGVKNPTAGKLYCIAWQDNTDGQWHASFAGYTGSRWVYKIEMIGKAIEQEVQFDGETRLGPKENYTWTGRMSADHFNGEYTETHSGSKGAFRMVAVR